MKKFILTVLLLALPFSSIIASHDEASKEFNLGLKYHEGVGVLQNDDKAISHYKKAANLGEPSAAYNLGVLYWGKFAGDIAEGKQEDSDNAIKSYAWLKVSMALGMETYDKDDEKNIPIERLLATKKVYLTSYGQLQQGEKLASKICSGIKDCKQ